MSQPETILLQDIRLAVGKAAKHARLFRNHAGLFFAGRVKQRSGTTIILENAQQIHAGLTTGAGDLCGWVSVVVTPEMVGQRVAIFCSPDAKVGKRALDPDQETWRDNVLNAGGLAGAIYSAEDALALIASAPGRPAA